MKLKRHLLAAAVALTTGIAWAIPAEHLERSGTIAVRVEVDYGLLDSCDAREVPHIIEHVLLSETRFGKTPADFISALGQKGVRVSAVTRQDFTEYVFEGPPGTGPLIHDAVVETLGRAKLPTDSIAREIEAIRLEVGGMPGFVSQSHPFEEWAYTHIPGAQKACQNTGVPVSDFSHANFSDKFEQFYGSSNYRLSVVAPAGELNIQELSDALFSLRPKAKTPVRVTNVVTTPMPVLTAVETGKDESGVLEVLIGIPGRNALIPGKAREAADEIRIAVQAALREQPVAYTARVIVHQSNTAGWISVSSPVEDGDHEALAIRLREIAVNTYRQSMQKPLLTAFLSNRELSENLHGFVGGVWDEGFPPSEIGAEARYPVKNIGATPFRVVTGGLLILIIFASILVARWTKRKKSSEVLSLRVDG
jgi:hypothetical protein